MGRILLMLFSSGKSTGRIPSKYWHNTDFFILQRTKGWVNIAINILAYVSVQTQLVFSPEGQQDWPCVNCMTLCVFWLTRLMNTTGRRGEENKLHYAKISSVEYTEVMYCWKTLLAHKNQDPTVKF